MLVEIIETETSNSTLFRYTEFDCCCNVLCKFCENWEQYKVVTCCLNVVILRNELVIHLSDFLCFLFYCFLS